MKKECMQPNFAILSYHISDMIPVALPPRVAGAGPFSR